MICVDTNCIVAYLAGEAAADMGFLDKMLERRVVALCPVVVAELLSDPELPEEAEMVIRSLPQLGVADGYWHRAGKLRASLRGKGFKARLADTLIAQTCLDHKVPLLTRDKGFQRFSKVAGLTLL